MGTGLIADVALRRKSFSLNAALTLAPGTVTALVGPSGAGKTTLLRCLAGLEPCRGTQTFDDEKWQTALRRLSPQARRVGLVARPTALFPHLNVRGNVAFGSPASGGVTRLLERLELMAFARRYPHQLSAGEQQRVAIARAFAHRPRLLLLDEPFTALDPALERRVHAAFRELAGETPALLVTHNLDEACWLADQLGVMVDGKLLQLGPTSEVMRRPVSADAARVVGFTNVFDGARDGGGVRWGERHMTLPGAPFGPVSWAIRAERVRLVAPGPGVNRFPGRVERMAVQGGGVRLAVAIAGAATLDVLTEPAQAAELGVGSEVVCELPAADVLLFSPG